MILKNKKLLVITSLLTLLPIPVGLLLWDRFPETMAIHFGFSGQPDGFASVPTAVFMPPVMMLLIHWLCITATALDKGNQNRNRKLQSLVLWVIPVICNLSCCGIYALALGVEFSPVAWTMIPMGVLFMLIGNYMPKTKMNTTMGIKIPWTYSSEANWNATHRFGGRIWVIGGFLLALCGILPHAFAVCAMLVLTLLMIILPVVYSWQYYRKELAQGKKLKKPMAATPGKKKASAIALVLVFVFVAVVLFCGDIRFVYGEDQLRVDASMYTDFVLRYEDIQDIELREENVPGLRVGGYGSFRLLMGFFENEEFGTHVRYTYYNPDACVVVTTTGKTVVLSGSTTAETQALYQNLLAKAG